MGSICKQSISSQNGHGQNIQAGTNNKITEGEKGTATTQSAGATDYLIETC